MKPDFQDEEIQQKVHTIPEELPILPVRDAVIFPNAVIPLTVGVRLPSLINDVNRRWNARGSTQRDKRADSPGPRDLPQLEPSAWSSRDEDSRRQSLRDHHGRFASADEGVQQFASSRAKIAVLGDEKEDETGVDFRRCAERSSASSNALLNCRRNCRMIFRRL
jgi:ATP-dependent Lon protease